MSLALASAIRPCPAPPAPIAGPRIEPADVQELAQRMNLAGAGAGGGARMLASLLDERIDRAGLILRIHALPAIALRVMRVANSAYYGQSGRIASIDQAMQMLGLTAMRGIAAAACFDRMTATDQYSNGFDLPAFRSHCLATACAAQTLATALTPEHAEQAFVAGLLHDIGLIAQWRLRARWFAHFHAQATTGRPAQRIPADEAACFGLSHEDCGGLMLGSWQLPQTLVEAVAGHHIDHQTDDPTAVDVRPPTLASVLFAADRLATAAGFGFADDAAPAWSAAAQARHGLGPDRLDAACNTLADDVRRLAAVYTD